MNPSASFIITFLLLISTSSYINAITFKGQCFCSPVTLIPSNCPFEYGFEIAGDTLAICYNGLPFSSSSLLSAKQSSQLYRHHHQINTNTNNNVSTILNYLGSCDCFPIDYPDPKVCAFISKLKITPDSMDICNILYAA